MACEPMLTQAGAAPMGVQHEQPHRASKIWKIWRPPNSKFSYMKIGILKKKNRMLSLLMIRYVVFVYKDMLFQVDWLVSVSICLSFKHSIMF
jgi:hypothetical protein